MVHSHVRALLPEELSLCICSEWLAWAHVRGVDAAVLYTDLPLRPQPRQPAALRRHLHVLRLWLWTLHHREPGVPDLNRGESLHVRRCCWYV